MRKIIGIFLMAFLMIGLLSYKTFAATPNELVVGLINTVKSLKLHHGIERSLLAKLESTQKALLSTNPNHYKNSVKTLEAFKNEVKAQRGKHIPIAGADVLLSQADSIIRIILGTAAQSIGTAGGSLLITDKSSEIYGSSVSVPPGALSSSTLITVVHEPTTDPMPTNLTSTGPAVTFGPEGTNFLTPVTIGIPYSEQAGIEEDKIKIYTFNRFTETWNEVPVDSRDTLNNILYAKVSHFSTFQAGGEPPGIDQDAPHYEWVVVWNQASLTGNELFLAASIIDKNGDVPRTIKSLTVLGPDNFYYKFSYLDYYFDIPLNKGIYRVTIPVSSPPKSGEYIFTVEDIEGKVTSRTKTLTVMPIPLVSKTTFNPPDGADSGTVSTKPTLSWNPVFYEKTVYYRVFIFNQMRTGIYRSKRIASTQFTISNDPSHENYVPLLENAIYYWRVEAFDEADGFRASNLSRSDLAIFATGNLSLTNSPIFEGARAWTDNDPNRPDVGYYFLHLGTNIRRGVSGPLLTCGDITHLGLVITVTDPIGNLRTISRCLEPFNYLFLDIGFSKPEDIPKGEYIFAATDKFGNTVKFGDFLNLPQKLPIPVLKLPEHNSILNPTPTFIWEPVEGGRLYQINIDRWDGRSWVRVFESPRDIGTAYTYKTSDPTLNPNVRYRWRVRAFDGLYFGEIDNRSTSLWREFTVDPNAPYFEWVVAWNDIYSLDNFISLASYPKDPNGSIPGSIASVTVIGPSDFSASLNAVYDIPIGDWIWTKGITMVPVSGRYIFQVTDTEGKTSIAFKDLIVNPIPIVEKNSLNPPDGSTNISTTPTLSWGTVSASGRPIYYRVALQDSTRRTIYRTDFLSQNSVSIVLNPGTLYYWRVEAFDGPSRTEASNRSNSDWASFTTEAVIDPNAPYFNWISVWNDSYPSPIGTYNLTLAAMVKDPNGYVAPDPQGNNTIASLTVSGPNNFSYSFDPKRPLFHIPLNDWIYGSPLIPGVPVNGRYVFQVTDTEGKTGTAYKDLVVNPVPIVDKSSFNPPDGWFVSTTPTLSWMPVSDTRTIYYRVRIVECIPDLLGRNICNTIYDSPLLTEPSATIPSGLLKGASTYFWRVQAFDASTSTEASNRSNSAYAYFYTEGPSPDRTSPVLDSVNPPNGATGVPVTNRTISFTFSEPMRIGRSIVWSSNIDPGKFLPSWSSDRKTISLTYSEDLPANSTITWYLNHSTYVPVFQDLAGNPLPPDTYMGSFITGN